MHVWECKVCPEKKPCKKQISLVLSKGSNTYRFHVSRKTRRSEIIFKPTETPNQRLTYGLSAVYERDEKRSLLLAADQLNGAFSSLLTLLMQGVSGNGGTTPAIEKRFISGL